MRLEHWLQKNGCTPSGFARRIGVPPSTISRLLQDRRSPSYEIMRKIINGTNGEVLPNDFFDLPSSETSPREQSHAHAG